MRTEFDEDREVYHYMPSDELELGASVSMERIRKLERRSVSLQKGLVLPYKDIQESVDRNRSATTSDLMVMKALEELRIRINELSADVENSYTAIDNFSKETVQKMGEKVDEGTLHRLLDKIHRVLSDVRKRISDLEGGERVKPGKVALRANGRPGTSAERDRLGLLAHVLPSKSRLG
jgi:predicted  nucleic acid-binding Zn-ribbon protein